MSLLTSAYAPKKSTDKRLLLLINRFAAALRDVKMWVLNVVNVNAPDTLPIIYERGLFGIYHDWCESFSTYPRTYDLLHADHLFSQLKKRYIILVVVYLWSRTIVVSALINDFDVAFVGAKLLL